MLKTYPKPATNGSPVKADLSWQDRGACKGPCQAIFFPPPRLERRTDRRHREARAKEICRACAVQDQCLAYALDISEQHGIWGGLTARERRALKKPTAVSL